LDVSFPSKIKTQQEMHGQEYGGDMARIKGTGEHQNIKIEVT
jgi:hypothetical protein